MKKHVLHMKRIVSVIVMLTCLTSSLLLPAGATENGVDAAYEAKKAAYREKLKADDVTTDDFLTGRLYPDSVCYGYYNIDLHSYKKNAAFETPSGRLPEGVVPNVTYRALCVKGLRNLLVAGRCASADRETMSALRVKASCMAMGEVAGTAAALAADGAVRSLDIALLKETLRENGAIVPDRALFAPIE